MKGIHGGDWAGFETEYGSLPLDFSANVSPLGLPEGVYKAALQALRNTDVLLVPWEGSTAGKSPAIHDVLKPLQDQNGLSVGILIGPEGGISETEIQWLQSNANATAVTLGPRILRTETAAIAATVLVLGALGEMQ